jgi:hypothetical protein
VSDNWAGWPPDWPRSEKYLTGRQTCRRCGRQLQYTWGRVTPGAWMHKECAIALAAEHLATFGAANAARPPVVLLTGDEEDEFLDS